MVIATTDLDTWLREARRKISAVSEDPGLEAQLILAKIIEKPRSWVLAHPEAKLTSDQMIQANRLLDECSAGVPLPYLLGRQEFFGLEFVVSPAVLIPRPETELLVEQALAWLTAHPQRRQAADVGTGSGCIAVSLASHILDLQVLAVDQSAEALKIASQNLTRHQVDRQVKTAQGNLLTGVTAQFDLVCANLPYIPTRTLLTLPVANHEPWSALDGGEDGLDLIAHLLADAPRWMLPGGLMLLEIEAGQGETAAALADRLLPQAKNWVVNDLAGWPRLLIVEFPEE